MKKKKTTNKAEAKVKGIIQQSIIVKQELLSDVVFIETMNKVVEACVKSLRKGGKVMFCGNGGSAADAQHLAAELTGRFYFDRPPLNAEALHVNTSYLTAVANDYSFDEVFSRLVRARGRKGDVIIGISTSGNSKNVILALRVAREMGIITVGMTGETGGLMKDLCNYQLKVPSADTPRIQETHILIGHILCELVESKMFPG
ncbi:MAG: D-sedoheptulose 7-phosphate isomerase [Bacteroidetes bacterium]|nr:D-sedoheptulose 7-phosphate isomerase [Bacteroidota bacterium]